MAWETINGEAFAARRKRLGLTQAQAAALVRCHRVTLADWERLDAPVDPRCAALLLAFELLPPKRRALLMPKVEKA